MKTISVLFICMGNICRSPTAEGVFRARVAQAGLADRILIDSAGTHGYHIGQAPDLRSQHYAQQRGYDLSGQRARQVVPEDFDQFDYVLAMDQANLSVLQQLCPAAPRARIQLFLEYAQQHTEREVPDPYYGGGAGFERVLDMVEDAADQLLAELHPQLR